jgi:hypothetical protein
MEKCGRVGGRHPRRCNGTNGNGKEEAITMYRQEVAAIVSVAFIIT